MLNSPRVSSSKKRAIKSFWVPSCYRKMNSNDAQGSQSLGTRRFNFHLGDFLFRGDLFLKRDWKVWPWMTYGGEKRSRSFERYFWLPRFKNWPLSSSLKVGTLHNKTGGSKMWSFLPFPQLSRENRISPPKRKKNMKSLLSKRHSEVSR